MIGKRAPQAADVGRSAFNDQRRELFGVGDRPVAFVCRCADGDCGETADRRLGDETSDLYRALANRIVPARAAR